MVQIDSGKRIWNFDKRSVLQTLTHNYGIIDVAQSMVQWRLNISEHPAHQLLFNLVKQWVIFTAAEDTL